MDLFIQLVVVLLIAGFCYWAFLQIWPHVTMVAEPFRGIIGAIVVIAICGFVLFYAIIPLLKTIPRFLH